MTTITSSYKNHILLRPDKIAVQTASEAITYSEWNGLICQTANWLHSITGIGKTIGIFMPNGAPFLQIFLGTSMSGRIAATFDAKWKPTELIQRLAISTPSIIIATKALAERIKGTNSNVILWENALEVISNFDTSFDLHVKGEAPFYMGFTSGTTGSPKAFLRAHDSWVASFDCNRNDFHMTETGHVLIPGALIHSHFLYGAVSTLALGSTIYLMESFSSIQALNFIKNFPVTVLYVVPTMLEAMLSENITINKPLKIICSGAKWEVNSKNKIQKHFPQVSMFEFYGASELSFVSVLDDIGNKYKPDSVGKPCHNVEIQIRNSIIDKEYKHAIGKIFVRSLMVFTGYVDRRSCSIQSGNEDDGWTTVDDMGYLDEDGYLYIVGREKNMFLYGGVNVFPEEIETILMAHSEVEEAAVIGMKDIYWGEIPIAVIKGTASKKALRKLCRDSLSSYKLPRQWYFVEEIPYTTSGKIARMRVKQIVETEVRIKLREQ